MTLSLRRPSLLWTAEMLGALFHSGETSEQSGSDEDVASWISWFCSLKGNEFFCEVEEDFIQDDFNLSGLSSQARCIELTSPLVWVNRFRVALPSAS